MKNRLVLLATVLASVACSIASADIYRWTDTEGRIVYSDAPPKQGKAKSVRLETNVVSPPAAIAPVERKAVLAGEKVKLYTTAWCGYCKKARAYLKSRNIPFEDVDVETTQRGKREFEAINGNGVPVIFVGERRMDGYDQGGLQEMLTAAGW
ncbi:MAG: glutaredoxin family protein [Casimicrobiaceae bacterium]